MNHLSRLVNRDLWVLHFVVKSVCFASALISLWASPLIVISSSCHSLPSPYIDGLSHILCLWERCFMLVCSMLLCCSALDVRVFPRNLIHSSHLHKHHHLPSARFPAVPVPSSPAANSPSPSGLLTVTHHLGLSSSLHYLYSCLFCLVFIKLSIFALVSSSSFTQSAHHLTST